MINSSEIPNEKNSTNDGSTASEMSGSSDEASEKSGDKTILASSQSRFCDKWIPEWLEYFVTFYAFPLNMIFFSLLFYFLILYYCNNLLVRSILLAYAGYIIIDRKRCDGIDYPRHKFPFNKLRHLVRNNWLYGIATAYHPVRLHKTAELPAFDKNGNRRQYFFTCHPHGVICVGTWSIFVSDEVGFHKLFPDIEPYVAGVKHAFFVPFFRDWCILAGCVTAAKSTLHYILGTKKQSVAINIGGAAEAFMSVEPNPETGNPKMKLLLKDRKGFCKVALQHGVNLVPIISLEEQLLYDLIELPQPLYKVQVFLQKYVFGIAPVLTWGNNWPLMPKQRELNVFVGKPIPCTQKDNPSSEDIDAKHKEYCQELEAMFHRCKKTVRGCEEWELELVDHPVKHVE